MKITYNFLGTLSIHRSIIIIQASIVFFHTGCKKLVDVNTPTTSISAKNVYSDNATAAAVMTGLYTSISSSSITGTDLTSIGLVTGLSSDELSLYSGSGDLRLQSYYQNNLQASSGYDFWSTIYSYIYIVNLSIDGLNSSTTLTPSVKKQLIGEAKFMRAFCYFYLVNLYGDIPLAISTDYTVNNVLARSPKEKIWALIISDLSDAKDLLSDSYLDGTILSKTTERVRPTKWVAIALLARSYLYIREWKNAEIQATELINNTTLYTLDSLSKTFLMNNKEAIWQLQPVNFSSNTEDAKIYIIPPTGPSFFTPVYLSSQLVNSFEKSDNRRINWVDSVVVSGTTYYFPYKYKSGTVGNPLTEYHTVFRLGEQYLIRSEARAEQNNLKGSLEDMNIIRKRAGLVESKISEKSALLSAIYHERQVELFTEGGHRWLDLKRLQKVDAVMTSVAPLKGGSWNSNWQLYPIPSMDIIVDGNLTQNAGY